MAEIQKADSYIATKLSQSPIKIHHLFVLPGQSDFSATIVHPHHCAIIWIDMLHILESLDAQGQKANARKQEMSSNEAQDTNSHPHKQAIFIAKLCLKLVPLAVCDPHWVVSELDLCCFSGSWFSCYGNGASCGACAGKGSSVASSPPATTSFSASESAIQLEQEVDRGEEWS